MPPPHPPRAPRPAADERPAHLATHWPAGDGGPFACPHTRHSCAVIAQPTGTVTLLFTDIEGSTKLLERLGADAYTGVLQLHRRLLAEAVERHAGYPVDEEGDALFVAFASAEDAVAAAADGLRALADADWPPGAAVRVRVGIHSGGTARLAPMDPDPDPDRCPWVASPRRRGLADRSAAAATASSALANATKRASPSSSTG